MKYLVLNRNGKGYGYSVKRVEIINKGDYNDLYVYLDGETMARSLAFCPLAQHCAGVWIHNEKHDYDYIVRLFVSADVEITEDDI